MSILIAGLAALGLTIVLLSNVFENRRQEAENRLTRVRQAFLAEARRPVVERVEDPREAGVVVMHLLVGQHPSQVQMGAMNWVAREMMGAGREGDELITRGRWLADQVRDPVRTLDRLATVLRHALDQHERLAFLTAIEDITRQTGEPERDVSELMRHLSLRLA
jgi:hypothetical protein